MAITTVLFGLLSLMSIILSISLIVEMIGHEKTAGKLRKCRDLYLEYKIYAKLLSEANQKFEEHRNADIAKAVELEKDNIELREENKRILDRMVKMQISIERQAKRAIDAELKLSRETQPRTPNGRFAGKKSK